METPLSDAGAASGRTLVRFTAGRLAMLLDWRLLLVLATFLGLTWLVSQLPLNYSFTVGLERGPGSDAPFLQGFYPREALGGGDPNLVSEWFRWSKGEEAQLTLPGVGRRGSILSLDIVAHRAQWDGTAPATVVELRSATGRTIPIELRREAAHYHVLLPPDAAANGRLEIVPHTAIWQLPGDSRDELGFALARAVRLRSTSTTGATLPDLPLLGGWMFGLCALWLTVRWIGFRPRTSLWLLLSLAVLVPALMLLSAPRVGFTNNWIITVSLLCLAFGIAGSALLPPLLTRLGAPAPPQVIAWLLLFMLLTFGLKYGGRLYPDSMPGDIQLHVNRFGGTLTGMVYLVAQHRGLPFPFPPGLYLLLAPLTLTGANIRDLFQIMAGLFEAGSLLLLYLLVVRAGESARVGLLAAAIYGFTAFGFMTTWFSFQTQTAAQFFGVAALAVVVAQWPDYRSRMVWWGLVALLVLVFLGHIGQFMNTLLLGLILPLVLLVLRIGAPMRGFSPSERAGLLRLLGAGALAGVLVGVFYYTGFLDLIMTQIGGVASGGLNDVTGKQPIPRLTTLRVLWQGGLITHFGFFPVVLAVAGAVVLALGRMRRSLLTGLIWGTFAVALFQALLPLLTLSAISTRWLSFSGWAIAVAGGVGVALLWQRGRSGRLLTIVMALYVIWVTAMIYIDAIALRKPPIEPF